MKLVSALILPLNFPNATVFVSQCRHKLNTPFYVYGHCRQFPEGKWQTTYRNSRTLGINMTRIYSSMKAIFASVFPSLSLLDSSVTAGSIDQRKLSIGSKEHPWFIVLISDLSCKERHKSWLYWLEISEQVFNIRTDWHVGLLSCF